ncbi:MAG: hypothetical protein SOV61_04650, partial [Lachnospiraceae bacterium]|nr:hypothetical protein [Lachnospiraceae bacterium]
SSFQRQICGQSSKKQNRKNNTSSKIVHIDAKKKTATSLINTGVMAVFGSIKCQRWDYNSYFLISQQFIIIYFNYISMYFIILKS